MRKWDREKASFKQVQITKILMTLNKVIDVEHRVIILL